MKDSKEFILGKITSVLLGTHNFQELARRAVDLMVKEARDQGLVAAGIFRVHEAEGRLYAYAYATKYYRTIDKLLPVKFSTLNVPLTLTENLAVKTVIGNQIQQSKRAADFSRGGAVPDEVTDRVQKIMGGKMCMTFPIQVRSGKVAGVLMLVIAGDKFMPEQMVLFETFVSQLGLAFSNVLAFEKLMAKYKRDAAAELEGRNEDNLPTVKFTLRITPGQDKNLDRIAREKGSTKAEIIRELLDRS